MHHTIKLICIKCCRSRANRKQTSTKDFAKKYNLGEPEFGNFYQAQYDSYVDIFAAQSID